MNAIEIEGLTKSYGAFKLDGLDLTLPCGGIMGLVGENGAGKSTTIRLMLGMARPDGGMICLRGRDGKELTRDEIGVVMDEVGITGCLTAEQTRWGQYTIIFLLSDPGGGSRPEAAR